VSVFGLCNYNWWVCAKVLWMIDPSIMNSLSSFTCFNLMLSAVAIHYSKIHQLNHIILIHSLSMPNPDNR
jgi:hypothetical protein